MICKRRLECLIFPGIANIPIKAENLTVGVPSVTLQNNRLKRLRREEIKRINPTNAVIIERDSFFFFLFPGLSHRARQWRDLCGGSAASCCADGLWCWSVDYSTVGSHHSGGSVQLSLAVWGTVAKNIRCYCRLGSKWRGSLPFVKTICCRPPWSRCRTPAEPVSVPGHVSAQRLLLHLEQACLDWLEAKSPPGVSVSRHEVR